MRSRRMPRAHHASRSHTCGGGSRAVFHQRCRKSKGSMWTNFILYVYSYPALPSPSLFFCSSLMTSLTSSLPPPYLTKMGTTNHSYPNWSPYPGLMTSSLRCISTRFLMGAVHIGMVLGVRWVWGVKGCVLFFPYLVFCLVCVTPPSLSSFIHHLTKTGDMASFLLLTESKYFLGK